MNATDALNRLKRMVQSSIEPTLSDAELDDLLSLAQVVDADGRKPSNDAWEPTYGAIEINGSAAEGWRWKAAKLGAGETFSSDGATFNPETRRQFCMDMAKQYQSRIHGTQRMTGRTANSINGAVWLYDEALVN